MGKFVTLPQLDDHIATIRANIRDLIEQAASRSGAGDENRVDTLIASQQAELDRLVKIRENFAKK